MWSNQWQLRFKAAKCKAMQITNQLWTSAIELTPLHALEWVTSFKYISGCDYRYKIKLERSCKPCCNEGIQNSEPIKEEPPSFFQDSQNYKAKLHWTSLPSLGVCSSSLVSTHLSKLEKVRGYRWIAAKIMDSTQWDKISTGSLWLNACCQTYKIINKMDCLQFSDFYSFNTLNTRSHSYSLSLVCKYASLNSYRFSFTMELVTRSSYSYSIFT